MTTAVIATLLRQGRFELCVPSGQDSDMYHGSSLS